MPKEVQKACVEIESQFFGDEGAQRFDEDLTPRAVVNDRRRSSQREEWLC